MLLTHKGVLSEFSRGWTLKEFEICAGNNKKKVNFGDSSDKQGYFIGNKRKSSSCFKAAKVRRIYVLVFCGW